MARGKSDRSKAPPIIALISSSLALNKGKVQKKKLKKKLTSVSFMYVCEAENGEMLGFFSFFFPTIV